MQKIMEYDKRRVLSIFYDKEEWKLSRKGSAKKKIWENFSKKIFEEFFSLPPNVYSLWNY